MPTIRIRRIEHYKISDFSFVEMESEIEDVVEDSTVGLAALHKTVMSYSNAARKQFKKMFEEGEFEL